MKPHTLDELKALTASLPDVPEGFEVYPVNEAALARLAREAPTPRLRSLYRKVEEIDNEEFEAGITPFTNVTRYVGNIARPDVVNLPIYGPGWQMLVALPDVLGPFVRADGGERDRLREIARNDISRDFRLSGTSTSYSISGRLRADMFLRSLMPQLHRTRRLLIEAAFDFWFAVDNDGLRTPVHISINPIAEGDPLQGPRQTLVRAAFDFIGLEVLSEEVDS